jgi:4-hydroxybenzoate polyprenyltransferase
VREDRAALGCGVLERTADTTLKAADRISDLRFLVKTARPGFWMTSIWFYMLPLGQRFPFGHVPFWLGLIHVTLPLGLILYGVNDIADVETDRLNPRKGNFLFGARGTAEQLAALPRQILLVQLPFLAAFGAIFGLARTLAWFGCVVCVTACYNWPRLGTKNWPVVDLLTQSGYLLVFVLSSWVNGVPQLPWYTFLFGALFAMHSHLFGQIMDMIPDRAAGRHTTAVVIGIIPAKLLMSAFLTVESCLVLRFAQDWLIGGFLALSAIWFLLDATALWRDRSYTSGQMRFFFLGWNAAALVSLPIVWHFGRLASVN